MTLLGLRAAASGFDEPMSGGAIEFFAEGKRYSLRVDQAMSELEIQTHGFDIHGKARQERGELVRATRSEANNFGDDFPLGLPRADTALEFSGESGENGADKCGNASGGCQDCGCSHGILLMRHGGRAATSGRGRFSELGDFGLHVERKVAGNFRQSAGEQAESGGGFADAFALTVPGKTRKRERELFGEIFGDQRAAVAQGCECTGGAAELQSKRIIE